MSKDKKNKKGAPQDLKEQILKNQEAQKAKAEQDAKEAKEAKDTKAALPLYMEAINAVDAAIKDGKLPGVQKKEVSIYVGYYKDGVKLCGINKSKKFQSFFRSEKPGQTLKVEGIKSITKEEAKKNHYGSIRTVYAGNDPKVVVECLKLCL